MRAHYIQHVPFEDLAAIKPQLLSRNISITSTKIYQGEPLPDINDLDLLIIMGGPMGTGDEDLFPWLQDEKIFIESAINKDKHILGICLGAQLIANVLGARVYKNRYREIGWFPVELLNARPDSGLFRDFPRVFSPFHWHGDTFDIPRGAIKTAAGIGCANQAFSYNDKIAGLQFHLEATEGSIQNLIDNCGDDITAGRFVQKPKEIISESYSKIKKIHELLGIFLKNFLPADNV